MKRYASFTVSLRRVSICFFILLVSSVLAAAQHQVLAANIIGQLAELTALDGAANNVFGGSVAISGNIIVVGAPGANSNKGAVYVFVKPANGWGNMTQVLELTSPDSAEGDGFGQSVGISGSTIVVGAPSHHMGRNRRTGAAYVAKLTSNGITRGAELTASDGADDDDFGNSVAISGNTVAVGALGKNNFIGAAYVFVQPPSGWTHMTQTAELTSTDQVHQQFGISMAMYGNTVIAGAWNDTGQPGAAYVFVQPATGWTNMTQTAKLTASDGQPKDEFAAPSVSTDGDAVVVGAPDANLGDGAAYVFVEPSSGWVNMTETAKLTASDGGESDGFGVSVSIINGVALVGAPSATINGNLAQGAAYVYSEPKTGWSTTSAFYAKLTALDGAARDHLGVSASLGGNTGIIGASGANAAQGKAYVFGRQ